MYNDSVLISVLKRLMTSKEILSIPDNVENQQLAIAIIYVFQDYANIKDGYKFSWGYEGLSCPELIEHIKEVVYNVKNKGMKVKCLKFKENSEKILEKMEDFFESEENSNFERSTYFLLKASTYHFKNVCMKFLKGDVVDCFLLMTSKYNKDQIQIFF